VDDTASSGPDDSRALSPDSPPAEPASEEPDPSAPGASVEASAGAGTATGDTGRRRFRRNRPKRKKAPWWELPLLVVIAIAVAVVIKTFLIQPFYIPSESMERTLHGCTGCSGDRILVNKPIYDIRDPHPGDIVVFKAPSEVWYNNEPSPAAPSNPIVRGVRSFGQLIGVVPPDEHDLVKRVIAIGGEGIKGTSDGKVWVSPNGVSGPWRALNEPYVSSQLSGSMAVFGPLTVPKGRIWVMGDNRANSDDSRFHYENEYKGDAVDSTVPNGNVIGKAVVIAWPPSRWRTLGTPSTFTKAGASALGVAQGGGAAALVLPIWLFRRRRRRIE
jgi:signal peptidase I